MNDQCCQTCCPELENLLTPALFKALGDPNRVALLVALASDCRPKTVSEMAACCAVDVSVVSRHLATLRAAGVLHAVKRGKHVFHSVRFEHLVRLLRELADALEACCVTPGSTSTPATVGNVEQECQEKV